MQSHFRSVLRTRSWKAAVCSALIAAPATFIAPAAFAADAPAVSVGAGIRGFFGATSYDGPSAPDDVNDFELNSARIYISGTVTENIKVMFNTEYTGADEDINVIDAAAMFSFGEKLNIWAGRFLPPSDRANLYGPYYASHWGVYIDGVQDGYPFETTGRDDGVMYWGQFGIAKLSFGAFDVQGLTKGDSEGAVRRARAIRLLGQGRRLLPERHVLRRQGPARPRLRRPDRWQRQGLQRRLPAREEAQQRGRRDDREPVQQVRRPRRLRRS